LLKFSDSKETVHQKIGWIIIAIGIGLRLIRYLHNPSLWFDEAVIGLDIIKRPFADLIDPSPDWSAKHPLAFLVMVKLAIQIFGNSEYALRLFPLVSGIFSLFLFYKISKHYLGPYGALIGLALFAILDPLVFQSSNVKPYSSDITVALLILAFAIYIESLKITPLHFVFYSFFGASFVWLSHPSVFVLAGIGMSLILFKLLDKENVEVKKIMAISAIWAMSFIANYFMYIRKLQAAFNISVKEMLSVMEHAYMPVPPKSVDDIKWYIELFFEIFKYPLGMTLTGVVAATFIIGIFSIYSQNRRKFFVLFSPILFTFLAAALHQYPFKGRFIFFLVPNFLIFIAEGIEYVRKNTTQRSSIIWVVLVALIFFHPLSFAAYRIKKPLYKENIKPILRYIKDHWQRGDIIYVHYYAQYPFEYYTRFHPEPYYFEDAKYVIGIAPRGWYRHWRRQEVLKYYAPDTPVKQSSIEIFKIYARDLDRLKGNQRVWILFTSAIIKDGINEEKFFIYHLENMGKQLDFFGNPGVSSVYLYDLSG
jgi:hypothetical protein